MNIINIEGIILVLILLIRKTFVIDFSEIRVFHEVFTIFQMQSGGAHATHIEGKNLLWV